MLKVSLVVPTYNEAKNIPLFVEEVMAKLDVSRIDLEFIVVDDNSPDGTGAVVESLKDKFPIRVIHRAGKMGLGSAVREGFALSERPYVGVMDADLSHDPAILNDLILSLEHSDIAIGSRFSEGSAVENWQWWRKLVSNVGVFFARALTRAKDPLSGYFFLHKKIIEPLHLRATGYKILLEILVKGRFSKITEIPFVFRMRKFSTSKLNFREYFLFFSQIISYSVFRLWKRASTKDSIYFLAIFILAFFLLVYKVSARTFWMDETAVLEYLAQTPNPVNFLRDYFAYPDNHPPLYYFLVISIYGVFPWRELGVRLLSLFSGLGIVVTVYYFAMLIFQNKAVARLAMFLTAVSSYFILISQMARYHSMAALFMLLSLYFFYKMVAIPVEMRESRDSKMFLFFAMLVCYTDLPHFFYELAIVNIYYIYRFVRHDKVMPVMRWVYEQGVLLLSFIPIAYLFYLRIFGQNDNGFKNASILGRSIMDFLADFSMHFYAYFFGENILPWDAVFFIGVFALGLLFGVLIKLLYRKQIVPGARFVLYLFVSAVVLNTLFLNIADPRYSFIVYPKYVFVAFPLGMLLLSYLVYSLKRAVIRYLAMVSVILVFIVGLYNFYNRSHYLNGSYFNSFKNYTFVKEKSVAGDYVVINGDNNKGVYDFYKTVYFNNVSPVSIFDLSTSTMSVSDRVWFFATGSDGDAVYGSASPADKIPAGFKIIDQSEDVPMDQRLVWLKEKITQRQSYAFKYGVYLLMRK